MTDNQIFISAIITLWASLVALIVYIKNVHKSHDTKQQENIKLLAEEQVKNRHVIENNNKLYDKIFDHITSATK